MVQKPIRVIRFSDKYDLSFQDRGFDGELLLEVELILEVELLFDLEFIIRSRIILRN